MTPDRQASEDELVRAHLHLASQAVSESPAGCRHTSAATTSRRRSLLERTAEAGSPAPASA